MNKRINRLYEVNAEIEKLNSERRDIIQKLNRRIEDIDTCCSELQNECETQERLENDELDEVERGIMELAASFPRGMEHCNMRAFTIEQREKVGELVGRGILKHIVINRHSYYQPVNWKKREIKSSPNQRASHLLRENKNDGNQKDHSNARLHFAR